MAIRSPITLIREKVEDVDLKFFKTLKENDLLFIDSTHMIKPIGDVLKIYLEILPSLNKGVIIHIHDIFTPHNYPKAWLIDQVKLWNEQYLLEAPLSFNESFEVISPSSFIYHNNPYFNQIVNNPSNLQLFQGSFYIRKIK